MCSGGGDGDFRAGGGGDDRRGDEGGDDGGFGVAMRSSTGGVPVLLLLRFLSLRSDLLGTIGRLEVDAWGGVVSILAFFRGGLESDASVESSSTTFGFPRGRTGGSSTIGLSLLGLADDCASLC